jgi:hypothetical protein
MRNIRRARMAMMAAGAWASAAIVAMVLVVSLSATPLAAGQYDNLPWVAGTGTVTLGDKTMNQAQEQALHDARNMAVEKVTGIMVHSISERVQQENGNSYIDQYREISAIETSGFIVEEQHPVFRFEQIEDKLFQVICEIQAKVAVESRQPNSSFVLRVGIKDRLNKMFRSGEELVLEVQSSLDCYLTIFNVYTDGTVALLLPNKDMLNNRISANQMVEIPSEKQRKDNIKFTLIASSDRDITEEYILVVATLEDHPFMSNRKTDLGGSFIPIFEADPEEMSRWMLKIPRDERTRAETFYSIVH